MRRILNRLQLILLISLIFISVLSLNNIWAQKEISLQKIFASGEFFPDYAEDVFPMKDGEHYCVVEENMINVYEYKTGNKIKTILSGSDLPLNDKGEETIIETFSFSPDEKSILITTDSERIYRRSSLSKYLIWQINNKTAVALRTTGKQRLAEFSPDGNKIAFVANNNLYYKDLLSGKETSVTTDGETNKIINGAADWVYEEEFEFSKAFFWSPDGLSIAYYRFDESNVKEFGMDIYGNLYPDTYKFKYPKAGEDNSIVDVYIYNIISGQNILVNTGPEIDQYIPRIQWTNNPGKLSVLKMNRLQNKQELLIADALTGETQTIYKEENKYYIDLTDFILYFTKDNKSFIISNETSGYKHLYQYSLIDGKLINPITLGNWEVTGLSGVDEKQGKVYFMAAYSSPLNRDLCSANINGKGFKVLTEQKGSNEVHFSNTFKYYIHTWSDANNPPLSGIKHINGKTIKVLKDNKNLYDNTKDYKFQPIEFINFKTEQGHDLNASILKPPHFDKTKKYPVIFDIYGGPGHQAVLNEWSYMSVWHQYMAVQGYIIVSIDNRGTGGRGEEFKKCTYMQLGKLETEDQIAAAEYFGGLPYVDKSRIGIWGWSFGGYLTLLSMTKGADYFTTGVAVAPVTNWRYYDNIYTERFMRTPQENGKGYDDNSPINHVKKLKGKMLIVHGTADDNVHYQNTMDIVSELVRYNKQFEMQIYPNKNHGIYGGYTRLHLFTRITDFFLKNL